MPLCTAASSQHLGSQYVDLKYKQRVHLIAHTGRGLIEISCTENEVRKSWQKSCQSAVIHPDTVYCQACY